MDLDNLKRQAAEHAVQQVQPGMVLGLGTGSTAHYFVQALAARMKAENFTVTGVPTSSQTASLATQLNIPLGTLGEPPKLDLAVDGADEIDPELNLIKGAGGALLQEKLVEICATRFIVIADESKKVEKLGTKFPVPVEVVRFGYEGTAARIESLGCRAVRRTVKGDPFVTDEQHYILDCQFNAIEHAEILADKLKGVTGVVEHGLFTKMDSEAVIAGARGIEVLRRR